MQTLKVPQSSSMRGIVYQLVRSWLVVNVTQLMLMHQGRDACTVSESDDSVTSAAEGEDSSIVQPAAHLPESPQTNEMFLSTRMYSKRKLSLYYSSEVQWCTL